MERCAVLRILGIDPGYAIVGYGVLEYEKNKFYRVEGDALIENETSRLICIVDRNASEFIFPSGIEKIATNAFYLLTFDKKCDRFGTLPRQLTHLGV